MTATFLIIETGQPVASMRRHGGFPHWIRVASGLPRDAAVVINVEAGDALPSREGFAGVIVSGSGAMVTDKLDWSEATAAWLAEAATAGFPIFGICYGHQLLAHALGGEVGNNPAGREMGTCDVELLPAAAQDPVFAPLASPFSAQLTHLQSVLRLPEGAMLLARSALDPCQAFRWGDNAWGVQFHPEFSTAHMRGYIQARKIALQREGLDPKAMLAAVAASPEGRRVLRRFVHYATQLSQARG
ncbi:MAG: glutamine amidotransferase [Lysobacter sp.]